MTNAELFILYYVICMYHPFILNNIEYFIFIYCILYL